ncbi:hypothetical protein BN1723_001849 [Verticillium longisporum]|uniref:Transketolase C-terminal domain-containing protein n=1 Tax=Verticillium longisporum TaxID=100787 RepID=A0A0G4KSY9_VERLO|nr:hypothetical protein BN1723_001849 [Verticillium longisporum]
MKLSPLRNAARRALAPSRTSYLTSSLAPSLTLLSRNYSSHAPNAKLNLPIDYATTSLLAHSSQTALATTDLPAEARAGPTKKMNLFQAPLYTCMSAIQRAEEELGISVELIDLRTIYPWDKETVFNSVRKTGHCVVVHEAMVNAGTGAEVAAAIQEDPDTFNRLEAPVARVAGWSIHTPLLYERFNVPDVARIYDNIKRVLDY